MFFGLAYMIMVDTFKREPHCAGYGVAMGCYGPCIVPEGAAMASLKWYGIYFFSGNTRWHERDIQQRPSNTNSCQSRIVDRSVICRISKWFVAYFAEIPPYVKLDALDNWIFHGYTIRLRRIAWPQNIHIISLSTSIIPNHIINITTHTCIYIIFHC